MGSELEEELVISPTPSSVWVEVEWQTLPFEAILINIMSKRHNIHFSQHIGEDNEFPMGKN